MQVLHNILTLFLFIHNLKRKWRSLCVADEGVVPAADEAVLNAVDEARTAAEDVGCRI